MPQVRRQHLSKQRLLRKVWTVPPMRLYLRPGCHWWTSQAGSPEERKISFSLICWNINWSKVFGGSIIGEINSGVCSYKITDAQIPCIRCGICCSKYQPRLSLNEVRNIAHKLGLSLKVFLTEYTDPRWPGTESYILRHNDGACVFLQASADKLQNMCLIQSYKPQCCLEWISGMHQPECREGLRAKWSVSIDSSGNLTGSPQNISRFRQFLQSLC